MCAPCGGCRGGVVHWTRFLFSHLGYSDSNYADMNMTACSCYTLGSEVRSLEGGVGWNQSSGPDHSTDPQNYGFMNKHLDLFILKMLVYAQ